MAKVCPLCDKIVGNEFEHYRLEHGIKDADQFKVELARHQAAISRRDQFGKYIEELNEKRSKGLITAEEWRRLSEEWQNEHRLT
jgi:hypothetical protein